MNVYNSARLQRILGPDLTITESTDGSYVSTDPETPPLVYIDVLGNVHTLPGGGTIAANVRASLRCHARRGRKSTAYVNTPPHLRGQV